jgi:hypothetical protein
MLGVLQFHAGARSPSDLPTARSSRTLVLFLCAPPTAFSAASRQPRMTKSLVCAGTSTPNLSFRRARASTAMPQDPLTFSGFLCPYALGGANLYPRLKLLLERTETYLRLRLS